MQILPDIYLLDGFAYANHPNFYLVVGPEGNVIVDAGTLPEELERADARAETWGISLDQVGGLLLLTHSHYDHIGNAAAIRERGAAVFAGPSDAEGIELSDNRTVPYAAGFDLPPCKVDHVVSDGESIDICGLCFDVIHAPGHTDGCIIYQLEHRGKIVWFVGDVVMSKDTAFTSGARMAGRRGLRQTDVYFVAQETRGHGGGLHSGRTHLLAVSRAGETVGRTGRM